MESEGDRMANSEYPVQVLTIGQKGIKTWLIIIESLIAISFLPWLALVGLSIMAFDSGYSFWAALFAGLMWSYPFTAIIFSALAWVFYARKKYRLAALCPLFSFLPLLGIGLMFVYDVVLSGMSALLTNFV
jgi:hypothetical protein